MCGRTACALAPCDLQNACNFKDKQGKRQKPDWRDAPNGKSYFPSYNIAPGAHTPVLLSSDHFKDKGSSPRVIQPMQWGLIPSWHKGSANEKSYETNNCRAESMLEKMTYKVPLSKGRRCVILAEGFFEWKRGKDSKQPYYIYLPQNNNKSTLGSEVKSEVKVEVKSEVNAESESDIKSDVRTENNSEIKPDLKSDTMVEVKKEADSEETTNIEIDADIKNEVTVKEECIKHEVDDTQEESNGNSSLPRLLTMAGVFDVWKPPGAILETEEEIEEWLSFGDVPLNKASKLIHAITSIECHPVSSVVNNSRNNTPECVKKIDPSKPKKSAGSAFMSAWLSKGSKVKSEGEPPEKKFKVT